MFPIRSKIPVISVNSSFDLSRSVLYQASPVAAVRVTQLPDGVQKFNNDVKLLFNQQRLTKLLGVDTLNAWLGTLDSNYRRSVDTSKLPDKVVLDFVRSRNIQSPSELLAWSSYLNSCADKIISDYNGRVDDAPAASAPGSSAPAAE